MVINMNNNRWWNFEEGKGLDALSLHATTLHAHAGNTCNTVGVFPITVMFPSSSSYGYVKFE
jgi:hypothetical protein